MPLIVEDGSIVANAESFASVAYANAYHSARGNTTWTGDEEAKEKALRKATDYMHQMYRSRWRGNRVSSTQALDWPRAGVELPDSPFAYGHGLVEPDVVPEEVKKACAELALRTLSAPLAPDMTRGKSSVSVGPISVTYDRNDPQETRYSAITALLRPYFAGGSTNARLEIA